MIKTRFKTNKNGKVVGKTEKYYLTDMGHITPLIVDMDLLRSEAGKAHSAIIYAKTSTGMEEKKEALASAEKALDKANDDLYLALKFYVNMYEKNNIPAYKIKHGFRLFTRMLVDVILFRSNTDFPKWFKISMGAVAWGNIYCIVYSLVKILIK